MISIYKFKSKENNMKLTESRLRQIINQEARRMLSETKYGMHNMPGPGDFDPEEGDEEDTDTAYLKCSMDRYGGVIVDEVGLSSSSDERQEIVGKYKVGDEVECAVAGIVDFGIFLKFFG